jgi:spoIIIJ-associated protein
VDEAIFKGLDELGLSIDEVDIEILEEGGKRFLGMGNKQSQIRLTERDKQEVARILIEQEKAEQERIKREAERRQARDGQRELFPRPYDGQRERSRPNDKEVRPVPAQQPQRQNRTERPHGRPSDDRQRHNGESRRVGRSINWGQPVEGGAEAQFLRGVLSRMGLSSQVDCFLDEQILYMRVSGDNMGVLIGRRGDTLNALQYLTSLVANKGEGAYKRIIVDTENYRIKREETLIRLARRMAEQVQRTGKPLSLEPMNPYERRVLHSTLQNNPHVTTHSEGEEPYRHVVITQK